MGDNTSIGFYWFFSKVNNRTWAKKTPSSGSKHWMGGMYQGLGALGAGAGVGVFLPAPPRTCSVCGAGLPSKIQFRGGAYIHTYNIIDSPPSDRFL